MVCALCTKKTGQWPLNFSLFTIRLLMVPTLLIFPGMCLCPFNLKLPNFLYFKKLFSILLSFFLFPFCSSVQDPNLCPSASFTSVRIVLSVIPFSSLFLSILCDFLRVACAFNGTYLFSVASEWTFISIIALFFIFCLFPELCQFTVQQVFFLFIFRSHISSLNFSAKPCFPFI